MIKICKKKKYTILEVSDIDLVTKGANQWCSTKSGTQSQILNIHPKNINNSKVIFLTIWHHKKLLYLFYLLTCYSSLFILTFNIIK